jgi:hypothetical protein
LHASPIFDKTSFVSLEVETERFGFLHQFWANVFSSGNRDINDWDFFFDTTVFFGKH